MRILALIIGLLVSGIASAATDCTLTPCKYVRAGANGTGTDWSNAYGSLPSTLVRGTTYFIAGGSYPGRVFNEAVSGSNLITIKKASLDDHGSQSGWVDTYGQTQAVFTSGLEFNTSYWLIDGQTGGGAENGWAGAFGFKIVEQRDAVPLIRIGYSLPTSSITLRHIDFLGKGSVSSSGGSYSNDGLAIYQGSNIVLSHYRMQGVGRCPFFLSGKNLTIEHGWVQSFFSSSGVHSEIASMWSFADAIGDITFRYNLFTDSEGTGGLMWDNSADHNASLFVYGNVFYRIQNGPWNNFANGLIGGWTGGSGEDAYNIKVYNNSFINITGLIFTNFMIRSGQNEVYNNLFYNSSSPAYENFQAHDYNHYVNSGGTQSEPNGTSTSNGNPFVDYANLDFRLKAPTAAGRAVGAPMTTDMLMTIRGSDGVLDRGALEYISGSPQPSPTPTPSSSPSPKPSFAPSPSPSPTPAPSPLPLPLPSSSPAPSTSSAPQSASASNAKSAGCIQTKTNQVNASMGLPWLLPLLGLLRRRKKYSAQR